MTGKKKPGRMSKSVEVKATPDEVWKALAEAEGLSRWFAPEVRVKPGPGGEVYLAWGGQGGTAKIEVWEPPRRLRTADEMGGVPAAIEYEVEAKGGGTTLVRLVQSARAPETGSGPLTAREREVVQLMVDGVSTAGIARQLGVSVNTVRNHTQSVLRKLSAHSRLEAAAAAVRLGLARPPQRVPVT